MLPIGRVDVLRQQRTNLDYSVFICVVWLHLDIIMEKDYEMDRWWNNYLGCKLLSNSFDHKDWNHVFCICTILT